MRRIIGTPPSPLCILPSEVFSVKQVFPVGQNGTPILKEEEGSQASTASDDKDKTKVLPRSKSKAKGEGKAGKASRLDSWELQDNTQGC